MASRDEEVVIIDEKLSFDNQGDREAVPEFARQIHLAFPNFAQTTENPEIAYSDHLPQFARIPLTADHGGSTLNVLSLNTLGRNLGASGIHIDRSYETDEEIIHRYTRLADSLALSKDSHDLDCILLQETEVDIMLPILKEKLGESCEFQVSDHGLITCHNKFTLTPIDSKASFDPRNRVLSNSFKHNETGKTIVLHNSWGIFSPLPRNRENEYRLLLAPSADDQGEVVRIVMGDTNSRIAPLDNRPRNIVTGAIPPVFYRNEGYPPEQQLGDYPDGGFYNDSTGRIRQIETFTLDFATGAIIPAEENRENLSWVDKQRMIMCLDHSYRITDIIGDRTLSEYEGELKVRSGDANIQVCMTATSMNDKGIAICFCNRSNLYKQLKDKIGDLPGVQCIIIESDQPVPTIIVPIQHISALVAAVNKLLQPLKASNDPINLINEKNAKLQAPSISNFFTSPNFKITLLNDLKTEIREGIFQNPEVNLSAIVDKWCHTEVQLVNPHSKVLETKTNGDWLGLHRNPLSDPEKQTSTIQFLTELKKLLDPNPEAEQSSNHAGPSNS